MTPHPFRHAVGQPFGHPDGPLVAGSRREHEVGQRPGPTNRIGRSRRLPQAGRNPGVEMPRRLEGVRQFRDDRSERHAGNRLSPAAGMSHGLPRPNRQAKRRVDPAVALERGRPPGPVEFVLGGEIGLDLEQQEHAIDRLPEEVPGTRRQRVDRPVAAGHARGGDDDRCGRADLGHLAEPPADFHPIDVGELEVEDHEIRRVGHHLAEHLRAGVGALDLVAFADQDALDRTSRPLLIVGNEDPDGASVSHERSVAGSS